MLCSVTLPSLDHDLKLVEQCSPLNHVMRMTNGWTHRLPSFAQLRSISRRGSLAMSFLLPRVLKRRPVAPPQHGIQCPAALTAALNHNKLVVAQTVTDGSCGLDAFGQALLELSRRDQKPEKQKQIQTVHQVLEDHGFDGDAFTTRSSRLDVH